jgi:fengycin family lipopeptide synthetase D
LAIEKERISINADFFELGGQSLKAIIMISKIHRALNVNIRLAEMFKNPTISGVSSYIKGAAGEIDGEAYVSIKAVEERDYYECGVQYAPIYRTGRRTGPGTIGSIIPAVAGQA